MGKLKKHRWRVEKAKKWYNNQEWIVGCNFIPSCSVNQLEMWQKDTFDEKTIDRELGWAEEIGFNTVRVFLHNLVYDNDKKGFLKRIDCFLSIASRHNIKTIFVLFDNCGQRYFNSGKQPAPISGAHNSRWVACPGVENLLRYQHDKSLKKKLASYAKVILKNFSQDKRILMWDLYNEPAAIWFFPRQKGPFQRMEIGPTLTLPLLYDVYEWAREINPEQPVTTCWNRGTYEAEAAIEFSDIITFHHYGSYFETEKLILELKNKSKDRPIICTEYLARIYGSTFQTHLPLFFKYNVGAINWGLVSGKTQTIYPYSSWDKRFEKEPDVWFHDIFRSDGRPYEPTEVDFTKTFIKKAVKVKK
ncbi:MAG: 1,4-beta-xylanase [Candidatus Omnitrophica bacterium]|nr:1,4-beta-xylanase [Candidatus Omnitrophota bacterium]